MNDNTAAPEDVFAAIWQDVLRVDHVGPDDDFFSLGGDSLLALKVLGAAQEQGLALTLLDLFRNPTPRGACAALASSAARAAAGTDDLLSLLDQARIPDDVDQAYPAARLQLGLIHESLISDGAFYLDVVSRTVHRPLEPTVLRQALDLLSARHPVLRSRFDLATFSEAMQLVQRSAPIPLTTDDHRGLDETVKTQRYEQIMAELAQPFDPETAPLVRVHASTTDTRAFTLAYSFHHAILDGWSEAVFCNELVRTYAGLLDGQPPQFPDPVPYSEFIRLEREAMRATDSAELFRELSGTVPDPGHGVPVHRKVSATVPEADTRRLEELSAQWGLPLKSLLLAANCAAVGEVWNTEAPVVGLLLNGRPERAGSDVTLGLFLNQLPLRLELRDGDWQATARRAFEAENRLLAHRRFPHSEVRKLLGGDPYHVMFNYVRFHPRDELLAAGLIAAEEDMRDHTSLPVRVELLDDRRGHGLSVHVTADTARFGDDLPARLLKALLHDIHELSRPH
ncbi:condensation domain-containing protein [Nocardia sp. NPDC052316]|uniref:condensation domain-containing protein n=1 Tax=Nocardia sp. NPDC052316 TaxID=3364329 RepID=UPI0037CA183D